MFRSPLRVADIYEVNNRSCWGDDPSGQAHVEIVADATWGSDQPAPQGHVQLAWSTPDGRQRLVDVVAWRRLDLGPWTVGQEFEATVQARPGRDLRLPVMSKSLRLVFTFDPRDAVEVLVGEPQRLGGWRYGVRMTGVKVPSRRALPLRAPAI